MDFGEMVRQKRHEKGWDIRKLSEYSAITPSAISRIENGKSKPFLDSVIRLCETLYIDPQEFIHMTNLQNLNISIRRNQFPDSPSILNRKDLQNILSIFTLNPVASFIDLIKISNKYLQEDFYGRSMKYIVNNMPSVKPSNTMDDIINLFEKLIYPIHLDCQIIVDTNKKGGALLLIDIASYMKSIRLDRNLTLIDLHKIVNMPQSALSNWENAFYKNIKLEDVLTLDNALRTHGEFITLAWNVVEYHPIIRDGNIQRKLSIQEIELCNGIIKFYRTLQSQSKADSIKWVKDIRSLYH